MNNLLAVDAAHRGSGNENSLIEACVSGIDQCLTVLDCTSNEAYQCCLQGNSSIGSHMRHIIDRFDCFLSGLQTGKVNFDARNRDRKIELSPGAASKALALLPQKLIACQDQLDSDLLVIESIDAGRDSVAVNSSVNRELMGLVSHTIHHLAVIALLLRAQGFEIGDNIGKAPSTLKYERSQA